MATNGRKNANPGLMALKQASLLKSLALAKAALEHGRLKQVSNSSRAGNRVSRSAQAA